MGHVASKMERHSSAHRGDETARRALAGPNWQVQQAEPSSLASILPTNAAVETGVTAVPAPTQALPPPRAKPVLRRPPPPPPRTRTFEGNCPLPPNRPAPLLPEQADIARAGEQRGLQLAPLAQPPSPVSPPVGFGTAHGRRRPPPPIPPKPLFASGRGSYQNRNLPPQQAAVGSLSAGLAPPPPPPLPTARDLHKASQRLSEDRTPETGTGSTAATARHRSTGGSGEQGARPMDAILAALSTRRATLRETDSNCSSSIRTTTTWSSF
jgi:hypothetical protein